MTMTATPFLAELSRAIVDHPISIPNFLLLHSILFSLLDAGNVDTSVLKGVG